MMHLVSGNKFSSYDFQGIFNSSDLLDGMSQQETYQRDASPEKLVQLLVRNPVKLKISLTREEAHQKVSTSAKLFYRLNFKYCHANDLDSVVDEKQKPIKLRSVYVT
jgi:hypothetical protein